MAAADPGSIESSSPRLPERIGPFAIHGVLGRGATGIVFDATDRDGQRIALKVIRPVGDLDRVNLTVARFLREAKILEQVHHPGVVRLIGSGNHEGLLYLAMARVEGVSLLTVRRQGPLGYDALIQLGGQLADALHHLHELGVVHRDIKPANILIDTNGRPVITDFGISGLSEATGITRQGDLLGSPGFMAPEVIEGNIPDAQSDQFGLGRLLFELGALGDARKLPKNAPILEVLAVAMEIDWERFPKAPPWPELLTIIRRLMAPRPEDRYEDAARARDEILALGARELLDSDTLNEHIGRLALKTGTPWETLADDLDLERPAEALLALEPTPGPPLRFDTLRLPALDESAAQPSPTPRLPGLIEVPGEPPVDELTEPPILLDRPTSTPRFAPLAAPSRADSVGPTAPGVGPPNPGAGPRLFLPGGLGAKPTAPAGSTETTLPLPPAAGAASVPMITVETQIPKLERQVAKLKDELASTRRQAQQPKKRGPLVGMLAVTLALGLGLGLGAARLLGPPAGMVLVGTKLGLDEAIPLLPNGLTPSPRDLSDAQGMLEAGRERQRHRQLDDAERLYALCIQLAELPECHRELGSLLSMYGDPAGRAHLRRYLELAPGAPDAAGVRQALDNP